MIAIQTLYKFGNVEVMLNNKLEPILTFIDETYFKNKKQRVFILTEYEVTDPSEVFNYNGVDYAINSYVNYHEDNNTYHHTEIDLESVTVSETVFKQQELLTIYKANLTVKRCRLNRENDKLVEIEKYSIKTIKPNEILSDNTHLPKDTTHIIIIDYVGDIAINNYLKIGDDYFNIRSIIDVANQHKFLTLYCSIQSDEIKI